jgi:hypothetical protein
MQPINHHTMDSTVLFANIQSNMLGFSIYKAHKEAKILEFLNNIDPRSYDLNNLLLVACWKSTHAVICKLVELGADIKALSVVISTPMMFIAERDMLETFEYFISLGADPMCAHQHKGVTRSADTMASGSAGSIAKYMKGYKTDRLAKTLELEKKCGDYEKKFGAFEKKCEDFENQLRMLTERLSNTDLSASSDHCDASRKRPKTSSQESSME